MKKYTIEPRNADGSLNVKLIGTVVQLRGITIECTEDQLFDRYFQYNNDKVTASWYDVLVWLDSLGGFKVREKTW